jgi:TRAP-type C4-dicarboxylate transport system permease small subunit
MFEKAVSEATRLLHILAAIWLCLIAMTIVVDVFGRFVFNSPLTGTAEIVANSVVSIAFLQIPFAIRTYGMLRTTVVLDKLGPAGRRVFNIATYLLGIVVFAVMAYASWEPMLNSWSISEYEGEGALRVPVYPVRTFIVAMSALAAFAYVLLLLRELRGEATAEEAVISY